jgi:hypothetical protein
MYKFMILDKQGHANDDIACTRTIGGGICTIPSKGLTGWVTRMRFTT